MDILFDWYIETKNTAYGILSWRLLLSDAQNDTVSDLALIVMTSHRQLLIKGIIFYKEKP